ncbi:NAD-glutamate dehydrogenase [Stakelama sediminis]|uniref:Glutamate dehydrogenase n=1 Tax=Stakelama sediminis TaxID=463200 RepID=A0A840YZR5_9SPHN|nr:NAD-glutamate dehydrogenase domain-containing protein [Stakelama sediminis]MBB5718994.1 glutamate dehydrogenase [Stakelama sediminis]
MTKQSRKSLSQAFAARLVEDALPGELEGFESQERADAARFVADTAAIRPDGTPAIALDTFTQGRRRHMRLAVINDDMPFLVDSIAATIGAHNIAIDRILHPVIKVSRTKDGKLESIGEGSPESMVYIEMERADAKPRRLLIDELNENLLHARHAVEDWHAMEALMIEDADRMENSEGAALLRWFLDRNFTLLGHESWSPDGKLTNRLGLARDALNIPLLADTSRQRAFDWIQKGGECPLLLKSNFISTVHRRAPLDLILVPEREDGTLTGISIHAGLWTSAAMHADPGDVPVLRSRLATLEKQFGFDPKGHTGKALAHALTELPHDLTTAFTADDLETLALTSMSIADRPRSRLILIRSALGRHLFAFVWLPRDELSTGRRLAIGEMLMETANADLLSWSISLEDGVVALLRYTLDLRGDARMPDAEALNDRLERMMRGWQSAVEAEIAEIDPARATRLALRYAQAFPTNYRNSNDPAEAARDILRLADLESDQDRAVRIIRGDSDTENGRLRIKLYRLGGALALSDAVPVFENFGLRVLEEVPTQMGDEANGFIHDFEVALADGNEPAQPLDLPVIEGAIAAVLENHAENDVFNRLIVETGMKPDAVVLLRAWFRYLRQTGMSYGLSTVVDALRGAPDVANGLIKRFGAHHDPALRKDAETLAKTADEIIENGLVAVSAIDDDRILRAYRGVVQATLRTNAFAPAAQEALAFKLDSARIPNLPQPLPWREIFVYSPRVEGIHLRAGPVARGGLRWSDRRDDFRTEILGLMKAQRVKNAVIVPTGAKGGFYPKQLPSPATSREAWFEEGKESYRIFIRTLLSITDNIVDGKVVHPADVVVHDGEDPYFVVAADKGTATFSDVANQIATDRDFWLGDAFASGGSHGYDHKAMGITARGGWVSVQRHFLEMGVDVQTDPVSVVGCGDMSGDVFGNGMLLSRAIRLQAAFDHRHIFLDPDPDPETSWEERKRLFDLPRSSWADYNKKLISRGGGVFARTEKTIKLSKQIQQMLDLDVSEIEPGKLISAILTAPVDLIWFGGIGTYIKAAAQANIEVGDPANDRLRVNAEQLRAKVIGEGANLGITQAARIAFAERGGRINTDFIDNSAGVDCSDNEVNIKIALNREVAEGSLTFDKRNKLLAKMTDGVADLVLEDNRLQTLALSFMENDGAVAVPSYVRLIEILEDSGRLDRAVEGLATNEELLRRSQEGNGLTRPELAVLLATSKLTLQDAIEQRGLGHEPELRDDLLAAFPAAMRKSHAGAIEHHRLRGEIVATKLANRIINRLGALHPFELAEEEGAAMGDIAAMFVVAERLFGLPALWRDIERTDMSEGARIALFDEVAIAVRSQIADLLRACKPGASPGDVVERLEKGIANLDRQAKTLLLEEVRAQSGRIAARLEETGAPKPLVRKVVRLFELDGAVGLAELGQCCDIDETVLTRAFTRLGQRLGLDWVQATAARITTGDPWERLLIAGLARDFQQLRLDFLSRNHGTDPEAAVDTWLEENRPRVEQFVDLVQRARQASAPNAAMLAQIAGQARVLLAR